MADDEGAAVIAAFVFLPLPVPPCKATPAKWFMTVR